MKTAHSSIASPQRRRFGQQLAALGGTVLLGFHLPACGAKAPAVDAGPFLANAFVRIAKDGAVTVVVGRSEMGQGVVTTLPQILAEELDADWSQVRYEQAVAGPEYLRPGVGLMLTGGSQSVRSGWQQMRQAGATARAMLVAAAARKWGVEPAALRTEKGYVIHGDRRLGYGELAADAAQLPVPKDVPLKDPSQFRLIGREQARLDVVPKTNGTAIYGIDVKLSELKVAVVAHPPTLGAKVVRWSADKARAAKGVVAVIETSGGIAVVADSYWHARKARELLEIEWGSSPLAGQDDAALRSGFTSALRQPGIVAAQSGNLVAAADAPAVDLRFEMPYLAHACMEPMNCTAWVRPEGVEVWVGTQSQSFVLTEVARIVGCREDQVRVHTALLGGGFGRRSARDFVILATEIAKSVRWPVKLIYSREDDMRAGHYRPYSSSHVRLTLGADGALGTLQADTASSSSLQTFGVMRWFRADGLDGVAVEGLASTPYKFAGARVEWHRHEPPVPVWFWRGVGYTYNTVALESAIDALAAAAGRDPIDLRMASLQENPRMQAVLRRAAALAGWATPLSAGRARGVALCQCFGGWIAQVVELSLVQGQPKLHRVVSVVDAGTLIDPRTARAQIESGVVWGLSAVLHGDITIDRGRVQQGNLHEYPVLRMHELPLLETEFIASTAAPGGVGEVGTPAVMAAVINAVARLAGQRPQTLPLSRQQWASKA